MSHQDFNTCARYYGTYDSRTAIRNPETVTRYKPVALSYIEKFRCLGADCGDSCCVGWDVRVDQDTYQKLQDVMQTSPEERRRMMASVEVLKTGTADG